MITPKKSSENRKPGFLDKIETYLIKKGFIRDVKCIREKIDNIKQAGKEASQDVCELYDISVNLAAAEKDYLIAAILSEEKAEFTGRYEDLGRAIDYYKKNGSVSWAEHLLKKMHDPCAVADLSTIDGLVQDAQNAMRQREFYSANVMYGHVVSVLKNYIPKKDTNFTPDKGTFVKRN